MGADAATAKPRPSVSGGRLPSRLELRTTFSSCPPQRSDEDDVVIEGVIEVEGDASKKDPAYPGIGDLAYSVPAPGSTATTLSACSSSSTNTSG